MYRVLMCAAVGALFIGGVARADETLKWRHVQHYASNQSQQVDDVNGHFLGLVRMPGIVFFPDGSTGTSLVIGTYDAVPASGATANGYYSITFADGSELWLKYTGGNKVLPTGKIAQKGTAIVIGGKGRYAGAKGEGTYEGEQTPGAVSEATISYFPAQN
jgi:hypothetical protein